jgi:parallel beta-helix repeat protein
MVVAWKSIHRPSPSSPIPRSLEILLNRAAALSAGGKFPGAVIQVSNCTIANNTASASGGGIYANNPDIPLFLKNTIIAGNVAPFNRNLERFLRAIPRTQPCRRQCPLL